MSTNMAIGPKVQVNAVSQNAAIQARTASGQLATSSGPEKKKSPAVPILVATAATALALVAASPQIKKILPQAAKDFIKGVDILKAPVKWANKLADKVSLWQTSIVKTTRDAWNSASTKVKEMLPDFKKAAEDAVE